MKHVILLLVLISFTGCSKEDNPGVRIKDGFYDGSLKYDNQIIWESFGIKEDTFEEYASGGVMYQKWPSICLTSGSYKILDNSIIFDKVENPLPPYSLDGCDEEYLLKGSYNIEERTDSTIVFSKNAVKGMQKYSLKLYYTGEDK